MATNSRVVDWKKHNFAGKRAIHAVSIQDFDSLSKACPCRGVDARKHGCTGSARLGDVVGHNANPKVCLHIVRAMKTSVVKGIHDTHCSTDEPLDGSGYAVKK